MTVKWNGSAVIAAVRAASARGTIRGANRVLELAKNKILNGPKTGRFYGVHQASAPGEAPASFTSELVNSGRIIEDIANTQASVTFVAPHAAHMEMGTQKIEPRPFLRPALAESADEIRNDIGGEIRRAL